MRKPSIHLNGTDAQLLFDGYYAALKAVQNAIDVLAACPPHGRDYYVQDGPVAQPGIGATNEAIAEHRARLEALGNVERDLEQLAMHVVDEAASYGKKVRT